MSYVAPIFISFVKDTTSNLPYNVLETGMAVYIQCVLDLSATILEVAFQLHHRILVQPFASEVPQHMQTGHSHRTSIF